MSHHPTPRRTPPIEVRAPLPLHAAIDAYATRVGATRSAAIRELLVTSLTAASMWPPVEASNP